MESKNLTQGSILGNIVTFALPYMLSYFLQILYGLADLFVIGMYCDVESTTAVSNGGQVMHMLTVIIIGLAMGSTVRTARAVGARDFRGAARTIGNTITLFLTIAIVLAIGLLLLTDNIVRWINTPIEAIDGTHDYLFICFMGVPFIVAYNIIASIFRGLGDSKMPMYFVAIACVVNIALDFIFIGYMDMGPAGAALATTLSQICAVVIAIIVINRHQSSIRITREDLRPQRNILRGILNIGIPVALQDGFLQIAFIAITIIANGRGLNDAAAVGIVEKFIGLLFIIPSAMLSTVSTISAQNIGAGKIERAQATLRYAISITVLFGTVASIIILFYPEQPISFFTSDPQVIVSGGQYLQGYVCDCILAGIHFSFSGFFTACGYSIISFCHNFISIVCARIPLSYFMSALYPTTLFPMGLASPAGSLLSVIICVGVYIWMIRHNKFVASH